MDLPRVRKAFLNPSSQITQSFLRASSSFLSPSHYLREKTSHKTPQKIADQYKEILQDVTGLQSILKNQKTHIFNRSQIEEPEGNKDYPSDTKSTKSGSNSVKTCLSSASNDVNSKQSNADNITSTALHEEDIIQKYYKELRAALKNCIMTKKTSVSFNDIAGNTYAKKIIQEAFVLPNLIPGYFEGRPKPWNKILLYGPPGVGKTMMCQAVASEMNANILWVSLADITSKYTGESEKLLNTLFEMAREKTPSVIIIDEMDSIGRKRSSKESETERRIKTEFLKQMDGISSGNDGVYVLATTNMPWELDIACIRRFERRLLLPLPDIKAREEIFRLRVGNHPHELKDEDYQNLSKLTEGYSGSDISNVVNDAMMKPARMLQGARFFKITNSNGETPKKGEGMCFYYAQMEEAKRCQNCKEFYMPCKEQDSGAIQMNFEDIPKERIILRKLTINDLKESIMNCRPTVLSKFLPLYNNFLTDFGHLEQKDDLWKDCKGQPNYYM